MRRTHAVSRCLPLRRARTIRFIEALSDLSRVRSCSFALDSGIFELICDHPGAVINMRETPGTSADSEEINEDAEDKTLQGLAAFHV